MIESKVKKAVWAFRIEVEMIMPQMKFSANKIKKIYGVCSWCYHEFSGVSLTA